MRTKFLAVGLIILCTILTSTAQLFYKLGANQLSFDFFELITNYYLIIGLVLYVLGAILLVLALKRGELSVLYPIIATSYIWVFLLSVYFFNETVNIFKISGVGLIILGVVLLGVFSK